VTTAWNLVFAALLLTAVFGRSGGRRLLGRSFRRARDHARR
jgi:hypothetical protein